MTTSLRSWSDRWARSPGLLRSLGMQMWVEQPLAWSSHAGLERCGVNLHGQLASYSPILLSEAVIQELFWAIHHLWWMVCEPKPREWRAALGRQPFENRV